MAVVHRVAGDFSGGNWGGADTYMYIYIYITDSLVGSG